MNSKGLFWFRRDLRLHDNAALYKAAKECGQVELVFVFDTQILDKLKDKDDKRLTYIWNSVVELQDKLKRMGSNLHILHGDPSKLIPRLAAKIGATYVYTNRDYESYPLVRDEAVQSELNRNHINFSTCKDHLIFEYTEVTKADRKPYTVFTPYKRAWLNKLATNPGFYLKAYPCKKYLIPEKLVFSKLKDFKEITSLEEMGFLEVKNLIVPSGSAGAAKQLQTFLNKFVRTYKSNRDTMHLEATSGLSTHLRFGTISIREAFAAAYQLMLAEDNASVRENIETWLSELIWREFYSMILQAFPFVEAQEFKSEYRNLLWSVDAKLLAAWEEGRTGYPIVDAGMRQLKQTGQMFNRVRMIVASFLVKDLLIDWRKGEAHFARYLLDYELASNNGGWQWAASTGTDAVPYFRIFNPSLQSEKFDPAAKYIKKWLPELAGVQPSKIHKLDFKVKNYPVPIVRHDEARDAVLALFKKAKAKSE
jgi:deoxyribodipyrimidine photo-lyase